jgi:hypothetical protein
VWSPVGPLFAPGTLATNEVIERMEAALRNVANGASEESIALLQA